MAVPSDTDLHGVKQILSSRKRGDHEEEKKISHYLSPKEKLFWVGHGVSHICMSRSHELNNFSS